MTKEASEMANEEQVRILKQGWMIWNEWREKNLLAKIDLRRADLRLADLRLVDLTDADLREADLAGACLENYFWEVAKEAGAVEITFGGTSLKDANLSGARLIGASFWDTNLQGTNFDGALVGETHFRDVDLSNVKGLETVRYSGPSTLGVDTLEKSGGNIPIAFLRGCGVSENLITYARSLVTNPIQYFTCFVSYSHQDQEFVERLYTDLQNKGIRCWLDQEDLKIGDRWREKIEEAIRFYDKLLLVLSRSSVNSQRVEREVEAAFEKERQQNKQVLFPIRLDEAVMESHKPWTADIRRMRHIGDFARWKDYDAYQKALERLLRDLNQKSV